MGLMRIVEEGLVDVISLNENEARILMRTLSLGDFPIQYGPQDVLKAGCRLHDELKCTVDIHTPFGSTSVSNHEQTCVPTHKLVEGFATGAGDVWDAGDILGHLLRLGARERLEIANACAYLYVASGRAGLPGLQQLQRFLIGGTRTKFGRNLTR